MPKVDFIQTSFAGGEFGPDLYGRTDIAQYQNACEIVENFLVRSYGPAISTPGTKFIGTVSTSTVKTRLIKFIFNRTDSYVIEMGPLYFRFYTNGGIVCTTGTTPFHLAHVFTEDELDDVQYTQLNDVIWLTHPNHPPQQLVRKAAANWTIKDYNFIGGPFLDSFTVTSSSTGLTTATITITPSATAGTINITVSPTNSNLFTVSGSTLGHHNSLWMIGGLAQTVATTGLQETGYVKITYVTNSYTATATVIRNLKAASATSVWAEGAWNSVRGYPGSVTFHERGLWFARTNYEPQKVWRSKVFEYNNFALDTQEDDDGLNLALASNESNEIQWLASGKSLIAGTYGGAFIINSGSTEPITPTNATASEEVGYGASSIAPRRLGNFLYYVQKFGKKLREMFYVWDLDTYKAVDRTILSPHILGDGVKEIDVQQNPESILYCVLTNGTLATLTREVDQDVTAWSRQITDGTYTSIAIIPSQTALYDEVWVIVERWINGVQKKYIELFDAIEPPARQDLCNYLHSSLLYDAFDTATTSTMAISLSKKKRTGNVMTTGGTVAISSTQSVFGDASAYFNATGDCIKTVDNDAFNFGAGDFTVDLRVFLTDVTTAGSRVFIGHWDSSLTQSSWQFRWNKNTSNLVFDYSFDGTPGLQKTVTWNPTINTWYHLAVTRSSGTLRFYSDGIKLDAGQTLTDTFLDSTAGISIGAQQHLGGTVSQFIGYMDEIRVSKGVVRWQDDFTIPSDAYDSDSYTSLLLHLDTDFTDDSDVVVSATVTSSGIAFNNFLIGKRLRAIDDDGVIIGEGEITATPSNTSCTLSITYDFDALRYEINHWGASVSSVSGLDHLEAKEISVLADGGTDKPAKTVSAGAITLANDYFVVRAGLPYDQIIKTLPKEAGSARGTSQGKKQKISEVAFKVYRSHKGFYVGGTEDELDVVSYIESTTEEVIYTGTIPNPDFILERVSFRDPATPLGTPEVLYTGVIPNISFRDDYQYGSQIYIKNEDPLPLEFLSIIGTLETFDK